jgi:hypothetical protein
MQQKAVKAASISNQQRQFKSAKSFQVSECNFEAAHANSTPAQCSTSQRRQLNASEMQRRQLKGTESQQKQLSAAKAANAAQTA